MSLTSKRRAELRGEAHHLRPLVQIGHGGIGDAIVASLDDALRARELVKVQLSRQGDLPVKEAAARLAEATGSEVVQVIGRTATLYRHNPELERKPGGSPPWRD